MTASIAHLSDPHITTGQLAAEPAIGLRRALGRVLALDPLPTCVMITGDLVDRGRPDEYAALREIIGGFPLPVHLTAGNHDAPEALAEAFGGTTRLGGSKQTYYVVAYPEVTVVALDSNQPGSPAGRLGPDQLGWLDGVLGAHPNVPAVVCLHHPPIPVGLPFLDAMRLEDGPALVEVVARHPQVVRVLAGHLHRSVSVPFAGSLLTVAPSTYRLTALDQRPGRPLAYLHEPTSFLLHLLTDAGCVTHTVSVSHAAAPVMM